MKAKRPRRWLAPWKDSHEKPSIYHLTNRVVDRNFVLLADEKEKFRALMRLYETFSGCRVLAYCLMTNHFHILLEVPPRPADGLSDEELLRRLRALYRPGAVAEIARQLAECREKGDDASLREAERIHQSFYHRMHDLSWFMAGVTQRFTLWFNRTHKRTGRLWEDRFRSVIVESGTAARVIAAYIDLNPVRAGIVTEPSDYRWCSYGEAVHGGKRGWGKKAREGLVRAVFSGEGVGFDARRWKGASAEYRELMELALERKAGRFDREEAEAHHGRTGDGRLLTRELSLGRMLAGRVRYFTDGAVIGSRGFVDEFFREARDRFGPRRRSGARKLRGAGAAAAGTLWSARDLRVNVS